MKICNVCKTVLDDSAGYCPRCKSQEFSPFQTKRCPFCNSIVAVGTIVCPNCHKILPPEDLPTQNYGSQPLTPKFNNNPTYPSGNESGFTGNYPPIERKPDDNPYEKVIFDPNLYFAPQVDKSFSQEVPNANQNPNEFNPTSFGGYYAFGDTQNPSQAFGYQQSSAKLNEKINSKIAQNGELNRTQGVANNQKRVFNNDEIVKQAYSELEEKRTTFNNDSGSPTYIYNQIYPTQAGTVVGETMKGAPNISGVSKQKSANKENTGYKIAILLSMLFLIGGIAVAILLDGLHFLYDEISGLQLATAGLPTVISGLFPSRFWEYARNGFLTGTSLAIYKTLPPLCFATILTAIAGVITHLFCFKFTTAKKIVLLVILGIALLLVGTVIVLMIVIFNYLTVGIGQYVLAGTILLSILTISIGYRPQN